MDNLTQGFNSLSNRINKLVMGDKEDTQQGAVSDPTPELRLDMPDEDIAQLTKEWEKKWIESPTREEWLKKGEENERYWLGKQFGRAELQEMRPLVDNIIFESIETFLPQATKRNPEPTVQLGSREEESEQNIQFADQVEKNLADLADELKMRLKIKKVARHWALFLLGVGKVGWDMERDNKTVKIIRPQKIILDPESTIDEDGYTGRYVGEYRKLTAQSLIDASEKNKDFIRDQAKGKLGTDIQFIEWWTKKYMCWTLKGKVLLKKKNPHWNYESEKVEETVDRFGNVEMNTVPFQPKNHFPSARMPYIFLSIFNLGKQPVDETSLISQNLSGQDLINKRLKQIDKNVDSMNGGIVVSEERSGLTKEQAGRATEALRRGATIVIPTGSPRDAVERFTTGNLPSDVFGQLFDTRQRLRDVFGVRGTTPSGIESEKTVRGKIISRSMDEDRIGGGITEYLEQFADDVYNWFVQLSYVYELPPSESYPKLVVSVKEGSLLPKDTATLANQAVDLAMAGKMSLLDLYKRLEYPNPEEVAANVWLEANAPEILYHQDPRVAQALGVIQQKQEQEQQQELNMEREKGNIKQGRQDSELSKVPIQ